MKLLVKRDESGAFQKGRIEISDPVELTTLRNGIAEYIEWMESLHFQTSDEEEQEMLKRAIKVKKDLENEIEWYAKKTV